MVKKIVAISFLVMFVVSILAVNVAPAAAISPAGLTPTVEPPTYTPTATATNTPIPPTETPTATPTNTPLPPPPTKTPEATATPGWDKSSIGVTGKCVEGIPTFVITNNGSGNMTGPSRYWWVNGQASAATCGSIPEDPALGGGDFQLLSGQSTVVEFPVGNLAPPYSICVAQRAGHPGTGYASDSIDSNEKCPTASDVVGEPAKSRWLFLPLASH